MVVCLLLADLKLDPSLGVRLRLSTCGEEPRIWTECWCYTGYEARPPHTVHSHTGLVHPATHSGSALASPLNTPTSTLCLYISTYLRIICICLHSHIRSSVQWPLTSVWTPPGPVDKDKDINLTFHSTYNLHTAQHHSDKSQIPNLRPQTNSVE